MAKVRSGTSMAGWISHRSGRSHRMGGKWRNKERIEKERRRRNDEVRVGYESPSSQEIDLTEL